MTHVVKIRLQNFGVDYLPDGHSGDRERDGGV